MAIDPKKRRLARHGPRGNKKQTTDYSPMPRPARRESPTDAMRARSPGRVVLAGPKVKIEEEKPKSMKTGKPGYNRKTRSKSDSMGRVKLTRKRFR